MYDGCLYGMPIPIIQGWIDVIVWSKYSLKCFLARFQSSYSFYMNNSSSSLSNNRYLLARYLLPAWEELETLVDSLFSLFLISYLLSLRISIGLQPLHSQYLHPLLGNVALLCSLGTWQRQDLPVFENAFIQSLQHPFFIIKLVSLRSLSKIDETS